MHGQLLLLGVSGPELTPEEAALYRRIQPAGFILFTRNIVSPEQTRKLTDDLRDLCEEEPIIAIDQEGGRVTRTSSIAPVLPAAPELAAHGNTINSAQAGALTGQLLRLLGFNFNFAPVLDLDHHPDKSNALRGRSWGRDPQKVIDHAGNWNRWLRKRGVRSCGKHFPGNGRALVDPHHELPVAHTTKEELMREDIIPYTALMPELDAIMLAHVRFPALDQEWPASLSKRVIEDFLRGQLGFEKHLVLTDDLDMGAIVNTLGRGPDVKRAIEAGNDLAMICHKLDTVDLAVKALEELPLHRIEESLQRIKRVRKKLETPLSLTSTAWEKACAEIEKVRAEVPKLDLSGDSPVTKY